ncbi:oncoprotein-induced transcript 3 protein-like [Saccostrea cucullata]|uniref:oncoprotein-induced transcript 3 protein-like n=1 Tax=Saccostrea cuccullata TaxID=36930 RepID=UPI002ED67914
MEVFFLFHFFLFFTIVIKSNQEDPCSDKVYKEIPDLARRKPSYFMDSAPLCDYDLTYGWYRGEYSQMPTSPPSLANCGTLYPFWLNGKHPPVNGMSTLDACKVGFASDCVDKIEIEVKNCNTYMVYKLHPVDSCNSAYCFGKF